MYFGILRDGLLENLRGGGAGGEVQKKYSRKRKLSEKKIHARQLTLKNIYATIRPQKIHTRKLITKKIPKA